MNNAQQNRGGAPVGFITELDSLEAASVIYLRLWCQGGESQANVSSDFSASLGPDEGRRALKSFEELCRLCAQHGRRPLMRHSVNCKCLGADESCFANFIVAAATGEHEDAMLMATLLVRPDMAPVLTGLAAAFGLALKRMNLCAPKDLGQDQNCNAGHSPTHPMTLH